MEFLLRLFFAWWVSKYIKVCDISQFVATQLDYFSIQCNRDEHWRSFWRLLGGISVLWGCLCLGDFCALRVYALALSEVCQFCPLELLVSLGP